MIEAWLTPQPVSHIVQDAHDVPPVRRSGRATKRSALVEAAIVQLMPPAAKKLRVSHQAGSDDAFRFSLPASLRALIEGDTLKYNAAELLNTARIDSFVHGLHASPLDGR